ncbi:MAG: leucyl aminopeptidase [Proteobacteria bacterium]|nr:MAG: leucyl aminopeptidase [Pseudomonadota bacterium]
MSHTPPQIRFAENDLSELKSAAGRIAVFVGPDGTLDPAGRKLNGAMRKGLERLIGSAAWDKLNEGDVSVIAHPAGLEAEAVLAVKLARRPSQDKARKAGASLAKVRGPDALTICAGTQKAPEQIALGLALRSYRFDAHKTGADPQPDGDVTVLCRDPEAVAAASAPLAAMTEGVFFTRDLVNEPANVLTTEDFAARLAAMQELGLDVEILDDAAIEAAGMRLLLSVGQGSESPSRVVAMRWNGGGDEAPLALIGKGVVFDSGGISIKPAAGMEEMTGDMGGAGTVAGVMRSLALRKAKANVVGIVGLVENMPSGSATRPGDIVRSKKGDTVEIINTDAEGRLVLADLLTWAQEQFAPRAMVDLATLTGAVVVALGSENTGVFANDDGFADAFLKAAQAEGEGAWRMPMGAGYDKKLKSDKADMKNVGGREGGAITAAQFLRRFAGEDTPWMHLDIAGTAWTSGETALAPKGATGWGVLALNRLIDDL